MRDRHGEKGAALVISILLATLLLAVAGTVILTSGMSATTSIDATAELQAYYGAESGLEAALNVLRGHIAPKGLPATTKMGFRTAVDLKKSNHPSEDKDATIGRLSAWLNYDLDWRVRPAGANYAYSVTVIDPDDPKGELRALDPNYKPKRIQVQSTGYGPKGSIKRMEMIVQKTIFDFTPDAMLLVRGADDGSAMTFSIGDSSAKRYSGHDNAGVETDLPSFGVTHVPDVVVTADAISKGATVVDPKTQLVNIADLPEWLQTADNARTFLNQMQLTARSMGRYFTSHSGPSGTTASPAFTFVNGNATLDGGAGLLVVTGTLTLNGNALFNGIIVVLGEGRLIRDGGGNGVVLGSMYVGKVQRSWPAAENGQPHPFLAPEVSIGGGGTADFFYDSKWVQSAKDALGDIVRDVREY